MTRDMIQHSTFNTRRSTRGTIACRMLALAALLPLAACDTSTSDANKKASATVPVVAHTAEPAQQTVPPPAAAPVNRPAPIPLSGGTQQSMNARNMTTATMKTSNEPGANPPPPTGAPVGSPNAPGVATPPPAVPVDPATAPKMELDKSFIDFGTVFKDDPISAKVKYTNTGKSTLSNIEFRPSCGCTAVAGYKSFLEPGDSGEVEITFNPKGHPGKNAKSVTCMSSDPLAPQQILRFECNFVPLVQLSPPVIQFGTVVAGNEGKALLTLTSRDKDFKIISITTGNDLITSVPSDDNIKSEDPLYPGREVVEFILKKDAPTGSVSAVATIKVKALQPDGPPGAAPQELDLTANIIAHVLGDMVIEPRFIRVAQAFPGQDFEEKVLVTSASGKEFNVTSATILESTLPGLTVRTEPFSQGGLKGHYLILSGKGGETLGMFRGFVEVKSDLPNESPVRVQFNGFVREKPAGEAQ